MVKFFIVFSIGIILLMIMLLKLKIHPVISLFLTSIFFGLGLGNSILETLTTVTEGFGGTMTSIGMTVIFGCIISMGVQDIGATTSIVNFFIKLFRGKNLELASAVTTYIMAIPVFGDVVQVLVAPISAHIAKRKGLSGAEVAAWSNIGATLTHGMVPPTPGILAVTIALGASLGGVILVGTGVTFVTFFVVYFMLRKWIAKEYCSPNENFCADVEQAENPDDIEQLLIKSPNKIPNALEAFIPLFVPIIFIASDSILSLFLPEASPVLVVTKILSDRNVALFSGIIAIALVSLKYAHQVKENALKHAEVISTGDSSEVINQKIQKTNLLTVAFDNWVGRGLKVAMNPLMITAMGGAMGGVLKASKEITIIGEAIGNSGVPNVLIPFAISAVLMAACGSQTLASMTAVGIVVPMMGTLGISPICCALSIGAGSMLFYHLNNSGFWVAKELYGLDTKQGIRCFTVPAFVSAIVALIILIALNAIGLI